MQTKWRVILAGWFIYATYMCLTSYIVNERLGHPISFGRAVAIDFSYSAIWLLLTPIVLRLARRFTFDKEHWFGSLCIHLAASIMLALFHKGVHGILLALHHMWFEGVPFSWDLQYRQMITYFDYGIQLYWIIILLNYVFEYYTRFREKELRTSQLEAQLAQAQLQALKMQLQPHFLFNTLNAISVLIRKNPALARRTLAQLSDLLRATLDNAGTQEIALAEEIRFLERYLEIERTRFGDRLTIELNIDSTTLDARVPYMLLQPLVENAIKHGITKQRGPARIVVSTWRENGNLKLRVLDNGNGFTESNALKNGVGLTNTRARLHQLYGNAQSLVLQQYEEGGVAATVAIPFIQNADEGDSA